MKSRSVAAAVVPLALLISPLAAAATTAPHPAHLAKTQAGKVKLGAIFAADPAKPYSLLTYPPKSSGDVAPSHHVHGSKTAFYEPIVVAPAKDGSTWVGGIDAPIVRFAAGATGNSKPLQTIAGPRTGVTEPIAIAVAADGSIWVANENPDAVLHFAAKAKGNVKPEQEIAGATSGIDQPRSVALSPDGKDVWVLDDGVLLEFSATATGDVAPLKTITGVDTMLGSAQEGLYIAPDNSIWASTTTQLLHFTSGATGDATPTTVSGAATGLLSPAEISPDADGNLWVASRNNSSLVELPATAAGNTPYIRDISGADTGLASPWGVAVYGYRPGKVQSLTANVRHLKTELSWKAPKHDGGAIIQYDVQRRNGHDPWTTLYGGTSRTFTDSKTAATAKRQYRIVAVNGYGDGAGQATKVIPASPAG